MNRIKETEHYKQIETIYPSDIAIIITLYLLKKKQKLVKSWDCDLTEDHLAIIDNNIIVGNIIYNVNGEKINELAIPSHSYFVCDNEKIYVADPVTNRLIFFDKLTGMELLSVNLRFRPLKMTIMDEHIFIIMIGDAVVYKYRTDGTFVQKWGKIFNYNPIMITNYRGSLYVLYGHHWMGESEIIRYSAHGIKENSIELSGSVRGFTIYEDNIYVCRRNKIMVYDIMGYILKNISVKSPKNIVSLNDNMIVRTNKQILVYSMEYS